MQKTKAKKMTLRPEEEESGETAAVVSPAALEDVPSPPPSRFARSRSIETAKMSTRRVQRRRRSTGARTGGAAPFFSRRVVVRVENEEGERERKKKEWRFFFLR